MTVLAIELESTMSIATRLALAAALALATATAPALAQSGSGQKLYRWVDEHGNVHFSDQLPPEAAGKARDEFNERGLRVRQVERARTPEEIAAAEAERAAAEAERQRIAEQRRQDEALLASFADEDDIRRIHEQQLDLLEQTIGATRISLASRQRNLEELLERAAELERAGRPISEAMTASIEVLRRDIAEQQAYIERKQAEKASVQQTQDEQIERYRAARARLEERR